MCGIIARIGEGDAITKLVTGLENLEYRGYDSAGVAIQNGSGISVYKRSGQISDLKDTIVGNVPQGNVGIGHTRWSTHGSPTDANAHPHTSETDQVAVVHNGIIENYAELKEWLKSQGHEFTSETDTEVIPHLFERHLETEATIEDAFRKTIRKLEGSYAVAALVDGVDAIYAARQGSPLILGLDNDEYYLASDVPAFLDHTDKVVYFEDGDVAVLKPNGVTMTDLEGNQINRDVKQIDWDPEDAGKGGYEHYMLKEIYTQPNALSNTIEGRIQDNEICLEDFPKGTFSGIDDVHFVACGTSYHAALYGQQMLNRAGIRAQAFRASEYVGSNPGPVSDKTLAIAVTQSGETADTLGALRQAKSQGARVVTVTNVVGSTAAREADDSLFIRAGPEIGVAATKTFSSQAVTLSLLALRLAEDIETATPPEDKAELLRSLEVLPENVEKLLTSTEAKRIASRYAGSKSYFFIGRGLNNAVAKEGALKFKEITYEHAEGFASGELKHGPLALVTPDTPIFVLFNGENDTKTLQNAKEAQARGAPVIAVASEKHSSADIADSFLEIPDTHPVWSGLLANVKLQLVSYHAARNLGRPIDKPRNLAKSVTVE
ncbi:glutamine--fructose-6-phosphate transaminase (isomerizing) [Haladaptatus pallidirubidus]|uniref:Glutamine--fructose-6-phosphate aminotransferase [isomerizing] n=1 Tax=Haladaptatus pallidirubidus TaxID=1008152 RepID=A0AAV3UHM0_9EURY|nr:glutamine--fructose-6-phosphate transaminase (isomerizing) [Haladaptatus pallidirubidus]